MLLVDAYPKLAVQVGIGSHRISGLGYIADTDHTPRKALMSVAGKHGEPNVGTVVLAGVAFVCNKNNKPRSCGRFRE